MAWPDHDAGLSSARDLAAARHDLSGVQVCPVGTGHPRGECHNETNLVPVFLDPLLVGLLAAAFEQCTSGALALREENFQMGDRGGIEVRRGNRLGCLGHEADKATRSRTSTVAVESLRAWSSAASSVVAVIASTRSAARSSCRVATTADGAVFAVPASTDDRLAFALRGMETDLRSPVDGKVRYWDVDKGGSFGGNGTFGTFMTGLYTGSGPVSDQRCLVDIELTASDSGNETCLGGYACTGWWDVDKGGASGAFGTHGSFMMSLSSIEHHPSGSAGAQVVVGQLIELVA